MRIAAFETSGTLGSVALAQDGALVSERAFEKGLVHGRELLPSLRDLVAAAGWVIGDVDLFAVSCGPGSYTGVRVGVATAKALAWALGKGILGVPSLDALAENAPADAGERVCPVVDARWQQVYAAVYRRNPARDAGASGEVRRWLRDGELLAVRPEELLPRLPPGTFIFGDGLDRYAALFERPDLRRGPEPPRHARASAVAALAWLDARAGRRDDPFRLVPLYLRPTEAEVKFGSKAKN
ncbi:MAG: tRNA (adenosine(37)-N6)-threonylcarbamoyltransferase complex dimerization subunit type 1 TsaB [Planctomycetes bacterium]|nr:tRNA (adenosine(37)-N6)-threonylcarbamoyltransferase complex dimerization subunit type 1 TsaB [Planctomycetota bacterium]